MQFRFFVRELAELWALNSELQEKKIAITCLNKLIITQLLASIIVFIINTQF